MASLDPAVHAQLSAIVGTDYVLTDADNCRHYGVDWTRWYSPNPVAVLLPNSTEQVQQLIQLANEHHAAVVPSGGRTGLSGGAVACQQEWLLSLERMQRIESFDALNRSVTCQAGVTTLALQQFASEQGLHYPVNFASAGSSHIGGNVATNAGGIQVLRYGLTRQWVSGLTVITGAGERLELNHGLVKNATGYDLRHLFIGSEGTLGIITDVTLQLTQAPADPAVMVLAVNNLPAVMNVFQHSRQLPLIAFEFFTDQALRHVLAAGGQRPFDESAPYYVLIEFEQRTEQDLEQALAVFEHCMEAGWVVDGVCSQSRQQAQQLWRLREDITESIARYTPYKNDIAVTIGQVAEFLPAVDQLLAASYPNFSVIWFGHIGDGNLHLSVLKPDDWSVQDFEQQCQQVSQQLFALVQHFHGSVSAEHGVGLLKKPYLHYSRSKAEIALMKQIKQVFDPKGLLNPGKIFD